MNNKLKHLTDSFRMARRLKSEDLPMINADYGFVGCAVDDRGVAAIDFAKGGARTFEVCRYDVDSQQIQIGPDKFSPDLVLREFERRSMKGVLLECTTLSTAEIAILCRALSGLSGITLGLLYVEPEAYPSLPDKNVIHSRDFELSTRFHGFNPIPGMCYQLEEEMPQTTVLLLGFEEDRAQRVFEELKIAPACIAAVFGVPAFQAGWENDAFANNLETLGAREIHRGIHFCGADNPKAILQYLEELRSRFPNDDTFFIAPLGSKPQAIGAVLFAAFSDRVGLIYDYPILKSSRSQRIAKWHLFQAQW